MESYCKATSKYVWNAYIPQYLQIASNFYGSFLPAEIAGLVCAALAYSICLFWIIFYSKEWARGTQLFNARLFNTVLWSFWAILYIGQWFYPFSSNKSWQIESHFAYLMYNIASLSTASSTAFYILESMRISTVTKEIMAFLSLFAIQLALGGSNYINYLQYQAFSAEFYYNWAFLAPMWTVFYYCFDICPQVYYLVQMVRSEAVKKKRSSFDQLLFLYVLCPSYFIWFGIQFINALLHFGLIYLELHSSWFGSDRVLMATYAMVGLTHVVHSTITHVLLIELKHMAQLVFQKKRVATPDLSPSERATIKLTLSPSERATVKLNQPAIVQEH